MMLLLGKRGKDSDKMFTTHTNESCDDLHAPVTVMNIKMNMITRLEKLDVKAHLEHIDKPPKPVFLRYESSILTPTTYKELCSAIFQSL